MIDLSILFKGLAQNILLFFSLAFLYGNLRSLIGFAPGFIQGLVNGLAFALIAIVGMLMRIELLPGTVIDGRIIMVGIAGAYGGPVTGIAAGLLVVLFRIYIGGVGLAVGCAGIIGGSLIGVALYYKRKSGATPFQPVILMLFGVVLTGQAQLWAPLLLPTEIVWPILKRVSIPGFILYPLGTFMIGTLLNYHLRQENLQRELLKSYAEVEQKVKERTAELSLANSELQNALTEVKTLRGFLPICASCKKIRDDKGYWNQLESYIEARSEAEFTHGICPDCQKKLYPDLYSQD
jgi:LytS/YehU family sensor histidine kinase